jgi:plastocyanin
MNVPSIVTSAVASVALATASAGAASTGASPAPSPAASPAAAVASAAPATLVNTKNFAYAPDPVTVHPGDTVTFENSDSTAHTVTADDASFDSKDMAQGQTWSHVFKKAGTYKYFCAYHTYMRGTIVVK